jgi:hypothetical protein
MSSRKSRNSVRKTRKARGLTVETLHASFERIDKKVHALIAKGATDSDLACCLHKSWKEQFHMPVSGSAVKALIMHYRAVHSGPGGKKTRKQKRSQKNQSGGMAPVDYMMGQGLTSQSFGRFPVEMGTTPSVIADLDLGRFYESNAGRSCNTTGGHNALNQRGGKGRLGKERLGKERQQQRGGATSLWDQMTAPSNIASTIYNGHAPHSIPINTLQGLANAAMGGAPLAPGPSPVAPTVNLSTYIPKPFDATGIVNMSNYATIYKP